MYTFIKEQVVSAPPEVVWQVISDVERYAEYAPNLSRAEKTGEGNTPARRCYDTRGRGWDEACVLWKEGEAYSYVIDTSDYPYPFIQMKGTWSVEAAGAGSRITMRFDYTPSAPWIFGWLMHRMVQRRFRPVIDELMDNWEAEILARTLQSAG